ncbi:MAG: hypothetical protein ACE5O2_04050 [Armatimonadota bacterium]
MRGTVALRGGQRLSGEIEAAQFGVVDGVGIGSRLPDGGHIRLETGGAITDLPARDIRSVEAVWRDRGLGGQSDWRIESLHVVTRDGTRLTGRPTWKLHATVVQVRPVGADKPVRIRALPMGRMFDPDNLLVRIEIAGP